MKYQLIALYPILTILLLISFIASLVVTIKALKISDKTDDKKRYLKLQIMNIMSLLISIVILSYEIYFGIYPMKGFIGIVVSTYCLITLNKKL